MHSTLPKASNRVSSRAAFTLLEVLVALSISVVLLAAVYAAINLHTRFATAGRDQLERTQIARAVLQRMSIDMRSVVFRKPQPATSSSSSTSSSSGSSSSGSGSSGSGGQTGGSGGTGNSGSSAAVTSETAVQIENPLDAYTQSSIGVFGDASSIVLHVSRPSKKAPTTSAVTPDGSTGSDLRSVAWFMATPGAGGLQGLVSGSSNASGGTGLARMEGDRLAMQRADEEANFEAQAELAEVLADEIVSLTFAYFDGVNWLEEWDSVTIGSLPRAIRVTIGFRSKPDDEPAFGATTIPVGQEYTMTVALPLAESYVAEVGL